MNVSMRSYQVQPIHDYYDKFSQQYDAQRSSAYFRLIEEVELDVLRKYVHSPEGRVLEVGCGTGIFLNHLQHSRLLLHGLDYSDRMLRLAQHKLGDPSIGLMRGDAQVLPYASNSFDVVYSFKVLAHLPHLDWALDEVRRVLRPDGVAVLELYNRHSIRYLLRRAQYFHQWHSPTEIRRRLGAANLSVVSTYGARMITPFACAMEIPVVGHVLRRVEKRLAPTAFNRFAGYYIAVCRPG
jgi:ubiquinone/menaquinone biosynthesis C-methylase UbiE